METHTRQASWGRDVATDIRTFEVDNAVTPVCKQPSARDELLCQQQAIGRAGDYVIDGRNIGTVVFPDVEVKVYLDASPEERARRRAAQNAMRGAGSQDFDTVLADIQRRDFENMNREYAPLRQADDALYLDSTNMSMEEVIEFICSLV